MSLILAEIGPQSFDTAIHKLIRTSKFMPTIEAIRDACGLNEEKMQAAYALRLWQIVLKYIDRYWGKPPVYKGRTEKGEMLFEYPKPFPQHIDQAVRAAGGVRGIVNTPPEDLHFRQSEFTSALEYYRHTAEGRHLSFAPATPILQLEAAILTGEVRKLEARHADNPQLEAAECPDSAMSDDDLLADLRERIANAKPPEPERRDLKTLSRYVNARPFSDEELKAKAAEAAEVAERYRKGA